MHTLCELTGAHKLLVMPMSKLEVASHVALIIVSVVALGVIIEHRRTAGTDVEKKETQLVGKTLGPPAPWGQSHETLVVAMTTHCPFCLKSMSLYRALNEFSVKRGAPALAFVVVSPEPKEVVEKFLTDKHFRAFTVYHADLAALGVSSTPTVLLVDQRGVIRKAYLGQLRGHREVELLNLINRGQS